MIQEIQMETPHLKLVRDILNKYLPMNSTVWVIGSRAKGNARRFSDLDLVIDTKKELTLEMIALLTYEFDESPLPYKVDLIDWKTVTDSFRNLIKNTRKEIFKK